MSFTVYALVDPRDDEIRYVGVTSQAVHKRYYGHIHESKRDTLTHKRAWIRSLLNEGMLPTLAVIHDDVADHETLVQLETQYIIDYIEQGYSLTNITKGGDGILGYAAPRTPEWREALSRATREQMAALTAEQLEERNAKRIATILERNGGVHPPAVNKGKPSPQRGKKLSEETKAKMRAAHRLRWEKLKADGRYDEVCANIAEGARNAKSN